MGRKRRADQEEIIDAVGLVIREHGLDGLSIDAVAKAAGIGKASVLYDFKSRDALLAAFVEHTIQRHHEKVEDLRVQYEHGPDATLHALVDYIKRPESRNDLCNGMLVASAASGNENFREFLRSRFQEKLQTVNAEAHAVDKSLLAFFSVHGLLLLEHFGFCQFDDAFRHTVLEHVERLLVHDDTLDVATSTTPSNSSDLSRKSQVFP